MNTAIFSLRKKVRTVSNLLSRISYLALFPSAVTPSQRHYSVTPVLALAFFFLTMLNLKAEVTYEVKVDDDNLVWVEVENEGGTNVELAFIRIQFVDKEGEELEESDFACNDDPVIKEGELVTYGPIEGPEDWENVTVTEVTYTDATVERPKNKTALMDNKEEKAGRSEAVLPETDGKEKEPATPVKPESASQNTPESVLNEVFHYFSAGDIKKSKTCYTRFSQENVLAVMGDEGFKEWISGECKPGSFKSAKLLEKLNELIPNVKAEISFKDGSKTLRNVFFKKEDGRWKIEGIEPAE